MMRKRGIMMRDHGKQGGLIYERHRQKIDESLGYMWDGNVTHYVSVDYRSKTKERNRYGPARRRSRRDKCLDTAAIASQEGIHE